MVSRTLPLCPSDAQWRAHAGCFAVLPDAPARSPAGCRALARGQADRIASASHRPGVLALSARGAGRPESLSFAEAIATEPERLAGEEERLRNEPDYFSYNHRHYSYLRRGAYVEQLRRWGEHFPRSQLLVIQSERLFREPAAVTAEVQAFLGLRPFRLEQYEPFLRGGYNQGVPPELRAELARHFEPWNRELYEWLGEELDWD